MGVWDVITDLVEAATPWGTAEAEAPQQDKDNSDSKDDQSESKSDDAEDEEDDEEEDEDDEPQDPKEQLEEECKNSKQCAPAKHHFDECVERVTNASDDDGESEDCVEEFFHLAHCATQCAVPKLWSILK
ncbi:ubiquinol-cytochrome C reductase hinge protein-domain-containing protein [Astrocystis sublimbata]|nr:ubiquinol-cytochrome C reductase hinge protein-domain-containing protein [Astrocystis sublimbata]